MEERKETDQVKEAYASMVDWSTYAECQHAIPPLNVVSDAALTG